ncbi:unnamed protein product [Absidia cylindrospora]
MTTMFFLGGEKKIFWQHKNAKTSLQHHFISPHSPRLNDDDLAVLKSIFDNHRSHLRQIEISAWKIVSNKIQINPLVHLVIWKES